MVTLSLLILAGIRALLMERQQTRHCSNFRGGLWFSLRLLSQLNSQDTWKSEGISITRLVHKVEMALTPRRKRKKGEPEPQAEKTKAETVYEEILHLPPEAGPELIELLESEKHILSQMAELEKKRFQEPMQQMWESIMEFSHKQERSKFDFKARSFEWQSDDSSRWICQYQSAERRVWLDKGKFFWKTCVKREGHIGKSNYFVKLADAVLVSLFIRSVLQPI